MRFIVRPCNMSETSLSSSTFCLIEILFKIITNPRRAGKGNLHVCINDALSQFAQVSSFNMIKPLIMNSCGNQTIHDFVYIVIYEYLQAINSLSTDAFVLSHPIYILDLNTIFQFKKIKLKSLSPQQFILTIFITFLRDKIQN